MDIFYHVFYIVTALYGILMPILLHTSNVRSAFIFKVFPFLIGMAALFAEAVALGFVVML